MKIVDIDISDVHGAKTTLSQLVDLLEGEEVLLARAGKPVARVITIRNMGKRTLGQWRGRVRMSEDFDAPLPGDESGVSSALDKSVFAADG